jgi:solute:Na+ symporter, SSS family
MGTLQPLDYAVFGLYFLIVAGYGWYIFNRNRKAEASTNDYFLAEGSLTWWAIGASLIASNISAEQFIGMSGSGFKMGLGISTYEWMAAATLLVVGAFFMPLYLKNRIFTMPDFLNKRYNGTVSTIMAIFWLFLYVFVNLTAILYMGAIAINAISGLNTTACMIGLAGFAIIITLGGMKVIGYTDIIQVFFLVIGGLVTTYLAVNLISTHNGGAGFIDGFRLMRENAGDHFHMIYTKDSPHYMALPGLGVLVGGMWIANLNYWGCNQYITQRALGADLPTARKGILFAAFLKLLMPLIVVIPGIAAYVLYTKNGMFQEEMLKAGKLNPDYAYPTLLNLLPAGLKGLSFAALTAAIVASLAGKANSISTIFTLDIYRKFFSKDASEAHLVSIGRWTIVASLIIAIAVSPYMGIDKEGGFQFIQEMTGLVSPGLFAAFFMGLFWKRTNSMGALFAIIGGFLMSLYAYYNLADIPFLDRMGYVFLVCVAVMIALGMWQPSTKGFAIERGMFKMDRTFMVGSIIVMSIICLLYYTFW